VKTEQMYQVFWPPIFREGRPQLFYRRLLAQFAVHCLAKFEFRLLSSAYARRDNKVEFKIYEG